MLGNSSDTNESSSNSMENSGNNTPNQDELPAPEVSRVNIRVPPFWAEKPALWFSQLESQFNLNGITQDNTKFWYVVAQLDNKYALEVEDIITTPPTKNKYATVKTELIKRLSTSQQQKLKQLLEHEEIGDRTPSQFLRHLRNLAGSTVNEEFLRTLWLNRLPAVMQAILAAQSDLQLDKLANIADKIKETNTGMQVAAITTPTPQQTDVAALSEQIKQLTLRVEELSRHRPRSRARRSSYRGQRSRTSTPGDASNGEARPCWYHRKFGVRASKCRSPCNFNQGNDANHR